ncbi:carbohydrate kinase, partial [Nanoarchaeota archaeon]
ALTKGEKGSKLVTVDQISEINASATNVVDTVGAGDAFTAALVLGLLKNQPLDKIHKNAERIASYVCSQEGATPEIPFEIKQLFIK